MTGNLAVRANLLQFLGSSGFRFSLDEFVNYDQDSEADSLSRGVRSTFRVLHDVLDNPVGEVAVEVFNQVAGLTIPLDGKAFAIDPVFDADVIDATVTGLRRWSLFTGLKFSVGQPLFCSVVEADGLDRDRHAQLMDVMDQAALDLTATAARIGGGVKGGSFGIVVFLFDRPVEPALRDHIIKEKRRGSGKRRGYSVGWST